MGGLVEGQREEKFEREVREDQGLGFLSWYMYATIVGILAAQIVPSHNGNKYQNDRLKAVDMRPLATALRIATPNAAG